MLLSFLSFPFFFQEPQITSRERQKPIMLGSAPSNQAVRHSLSNCHSMKELILDQKTGEVEGCTHIPFSLFLYIHLQTKIKLGKVPCVIHPYL